MCTVHAQKVLSVCYAVVTTTNRLRLDFDSTAVRLVIDVR